jgi:alpha-tubulin suppressor-like RCC1 family protein
VGRFVPKRSLRCGLIVAAGLAVTAGCGADPGPVDPDYALSLSPISGSVAQGGTTVQVTLARSGGFAGNVALSLEGAPSGVAGTFSPNPATGNTSTLTITLTSSVAAGTYPLTVKGVASGVSDRTASFSLTVTAAPGYSLALNPTSAGVAQGGNVTVQVTLSRTGGFTGVVALALENAPADVTGSFDPTPAPGATSTLTISAGGVATLGQYALTVRGTAPALADRTAALALTLAGTVTGVVTASLYSCALDAAGRPYCWGGNGGGNLGAPSTEICTDPFIGSIPCSTRPVAVTGDFTFTTLSGFWAHICGLTAGGAAYCWGTNSGGQLGDSTTTRRTVPTPVLGDLQFASISAGYNHTCGVTTSGTAYCWGGGSSDPNKGQLGDGTTNQRLVPTPVAGGVSFATVSAGIFQTCALTPTGAAYCWGNGVLVPTPVAGGLTFASMSASSGTCGVTTSGAAYCWGGNTHGQLGDGTTTPRLLPTPVAGGLTFVAVNAGEVHTCGVTTSGDAYCWGSNVYGALGDGTTTPRQVPTLVAGGHAFAAVSAGNGWPIGTHTCGITRSGLAYCWGVSSLGQLGDGTTTQRLVPTPVAFP